MDETVSSVRNSTHNMSINEIEQDSEKEDGLKEYLLKKKNQDIDLE